MQEAEGWFYEVDGERRGPVTFPELKRLVQTKVVGKTTKVFAAGMPEPMPAGDLAMLYPRGPDAATRWLLPVGRSGWAIAAGYLGIFSLIPFVGLLAILFGVIGIVHLRAHPEKSGWGRVIFALVMGTLFSVLYSRVFWA